MAKMFIQAVVVACILVTLPGALASEDHDEEHGDDHCLLQAASPSPCDAKLESMIAKMEALEKRVAELENPIRLHRPKPFKPSESIAPARRRPLVIRSKKIALMNDDMDLQQAHVEGETSTTTTTTTCFDTDYGHKDPDGLGCKDGYDSYPSYCGYSAMKDDDFDPMEMCCVCGGGVVTTTTTTEPILPRVEALEAAFDASGVSKFEQIDDKTIKLEHMSLWISGGSSGTGNLVVGHGHNFTHGSNSFTVGASNTIAGDYDFVAGLFNEAQKGQGGSGYNSILGGENNVVKSKAVSITGGLFRKASDLRTEGCVLYDESYKC